VKGDECTAVVMGKLVLCVVAVYIIWEVPGRALHSSTQPQRFLWDRGCA